MLCLLGLYGAARLNFNLTIAHGMLTTGVVGSFFVYEIISVLFRPKRDLDSYHVSETWMLLLFSLPYLVDFCVGVYGCIYYTNYQEILDQEGYERLQEEQEFDHDIEQFRANSNDTNL